MFIAPLIEVGSIPTTDALFASRGYGALLTQLNTEWGGCSGVIFGHAGDPNKDRYSRFYNTVVLANAKSTETLMHNADFVRAVNSIIPIACEADLFAVPVCMQVPILTHPKIRPLFEEGRIDGWGLEPRNLPDEDVTGRLIHNGEAGDKFTEEGKWEFDPMMVWEWKDDDPNHTREELDVLDTSREFVCEYIEKQMSASGQMKDPTDVLFGGLIRPAKKK